MASGPVRAAFKTVLETAYPGAYFDTLNTEPDFMPDESQGATPAIWYTMSYPAANERRMSIGGPAACRREIGQVEVWCIAASGKGDQEATDAADAVRDLLRDKQLTPAIRTLDADPPFHFTPDDGDYFAAVVAVSYVHEYFK